jgi:hypothetical protein
MNGPTKLNWPLLAAITLSAAVETIVATLVYLNWDSL